MAYVYQEFPKALYRKGEYMAVQSAEEEAAMSADGWADWHSDQAAMRGEVSARLSNRFEAQAGTVVSVQLGSEMTPEDEPTYQEAVAYSVGTQEPVKRKPGRPRKV